MNRVRLPAGASVGTVDKFQGKEAPVVIYSVATSRPEDAPRGMEFLYSLNRLNVATSRAKNELGWKLPFLGFAEQHFISAKEGKGLGPLMRSVDAAHAGDWILIHVGFALSKIDEEEAAHSIRMLEGMGQAYTDELIALAQSDLAN